MLDTDRAWAAGFLEADGSFLLSRRNGAAQRTQRPSGQGPLPVIAASQIDLLPLERLVELFGGHLFDGGKRRERWRPVFQWQVTNRPGIVVCLEAITPYLVGKREQAELLLAYCLGPGRGQPGVRLTASQIAARVALAERLSILNRGS